MTCTKADTSTSNWRTIADLPARGVTAFSGSAACDARMPAIRVGQNVPTVELAVRNERIRHLPAADVWNLA
jgi:hypothetical protein